jgi:copper transport protein
MQTHRFRAILLLGTVLALSSATDASAHTEVKSTSPTEGTTVKTSITRVTVTFTGALERGTLRVFGPDGKRVSVSNGARDPRKTSRLLVGLKGSLKPGSYTASWTIVAGDGHKQKGAFGFKLKR